MLEHHEFTVDGVTVHHVPSAEELTSVSLIFAVGGRDESLPTVGSLHALEHLCLSAVRDTALEVNGSVDRLLTQFTAYGRPGLIGPWLERLCTALATPDLNRLAAEAPVLLAEGGDIGTPLDSLALVRFGQRDLGLGLAPRPTPRSLPLDRLRRDAGRWFTAKNAVLVIDGPLPELRLPLTRGAGLARSWPAPLRLARPEAVVLDGDCVAVSLVLPPPDPAGLDSLAGRLIENRVAEEVRHQRSLAYAVDREDWPTVEGTALTVWAEPGRGNQIAVSVVLLDCVRDLLTRGPSDAELEVAREQLLTSNSGRDSAVRDVVRPSVNRLLLLPADAPLDHGLVMATTVDTVKSYLAALAPGALYLVAEGTEQLLADRQIRVRELEPEMDSLPPDGEVYRPPLAARLVNAAARSVRLVTTDEALWLQVEDHITRIRWSDAAGLLDSQDDDMWVVFSMDGTAIGIDRRLSRSEAAVATVQRHVPQDLWYVDEPEGVR